MDEKKTPKISIGITSLTVILCVLCLTVFSVLSLSTAASEQNFSEKRAEAVKNYYTAESEAASLINEIMDREIGRKALQSCIEQGKITFDGEIYSFMEKIDEGQILYVGFRMDDTLDICHWQVISTAEWTPDESLQVWDGEMLLEE